MLFRSKHNVKTVGVLSSRESEIDEIIRHQREVHQQETLKSQVPPRPRTSTLKGAPKNNTMPQNELQFLLRQRKGRRINFEKHPSVPNPEYVPRNDPHFVATQRGFLQVAEDGSYKTTSNPRWASTFKTFEDADAAAQKACKALFDVRGQFYAILVKP